MCVSFLFSISLFLSHFPFFFRTSYFTHSLTHRYWHANVFGTGFFKLDYLSISLNNYMCWYEYDQTTFRVSYKRCAYEGKVKNLTKSALEYKMNYSMHVSSYGFSGLLSDKCDIILAFTNIPSLPAYAFSGSNMQHLSFPLAMFESIDDYAFSGDVQLESISLEKGVFV